MLGGLRYPVFWLDLSPGASLERLEDGLTSLKPVNRDRLLEYCNGFFDEHKAYMFPPFIYSTSEQQIKGRPDWYDEDHSALVRNFEIERTDEQNTGIPDPLESEAGKEGAVSKAMTASADWNAILEMIRASQKRG